MNQHIKSPYLALVCALISSWFSGPILANDGSLFCNVAPTILPRSQGRDIARRDVGLMERIYLTDQSDWYTNLAITGEYTRTFRTNKLVNALFGADIISTSSGSNLAACDSSCDTRCIRIQGSRVAGRQANAWLADYFYLPTDFDSTVCFNPRIQNAIIDFDLYMGLDTWLCNTYLRISGPLTWTKWNLGYCEVVNNLGTNSHVPGYFNPGGIVREDLLNSFESYASGNAPGLILDSFYNVNLEPLQYARMSRCSDTRLGFADLRVELGWNPFFNDCYTFGFGLIAAAPTGTNIRACQFFDPVVGNGHHWEVGLDVHWLQRLWSWQECGANLNFFFDANVTHLFGTYQQRTFDLCNKPMSRYMLAEQLGQPLINSLKGAYPTTGTLTTAPTFLTPSAQFKGVYTPVANLTTLNIKASIAAEAEILAMFNLTTCNWNFDFGYNFWVRSCEKFECPQACKQAACQSLCLMSDELGWALKGDARTFGFASPSGINTVIPLSATESNATIHSGTNATSTRAFAQNINGDIDNPQLAYYRPDPTVTPTLSYEPFLTVNTANVNQVGIRTSIDPILLHCEDINFQATRSLSHKVFGNISYNWWDCGCWNPFLGFGGFAEFGKTDSCRPQNVDLATCSPLSSGSCDTDCSQCPQQCIDCAVSQWGVWIKGGISF